MCAQDLREGEPRFQRGFLVSHFSMPTLQIVENEADFCQRVLRHVLEGYVFGACQQLGEVEFKHPIRLLGPPTGGVSQKGTPHVRHGITQAATNLSRVVVTPHVLLEDGDGLTPELLTMLKDLDVDPIDFLEDLLPSPLLQIHRPLGVDSLTLANLPGIGPRVGDQRVGIVQSHHRCAQQILRPFLFLEK